MEYKSLKEKKKKKTQPTEQSIWDLPINQFNFE